VWSVFFEPQLPTRCLSDGGQPELATFATPIPVTTSSSSSSSSSSFSSSSSSLEDDQLLTPNNFEGDFSAYVPMSVTMAGAPVESRPRCSCTSRSEPGITRFRVCFRRSTRASRCLASRAPVRWHVVHGSEPRILIRSRGVTAASSPARTRVCTDGVGLTYARIFVGSRALYRTRLSGSISC